MKRRGNTRSQHPHGDYITYEGASELRAVSEKSGRSSASQYLIAHPHTVRALEPYQADAQARIPFPQQARSAMSPSRQT